MCSGENSSQRDILRRPDKVMDWLDVEALWSPAGHVFLLCCDREACFPYWRSCPDCNQVSHYGSGKDKVFQAPHCQLNKSHPLYPQTLLPIPYPECPCCGLRFIANKLKGAMLLLFHHMLKVH